LFQWRRQSLELMRAIASSLLLAVGQLADSRILLILAKSVAISILVFAILAVAGWVAFDALLQQAGLTDSVFTGAQSLREIAAFLLAMLGWWVLWRIVAMAVVQFYADDIVAAVEARHYPEAHLARRKIPLTEELSNALKAAGRALIANLVALPVAAALLFTAIGPAIAFWAVNAVLIGRELQDMAWLPHSVPGEKAAPMGKGERFVLGGAITALLAIPLVNFLAPVIGAASAAHLVHRKAAR
jgi:uncharacterized protein involved in cysteine biosynthesis